MDQNLIPKCPIGHEMELIQVAAGGWRYGCIRCATSFKARKSTSCGWLSPIKSTKERAYKAAIMRPLQKPIPPSEIFYQSYQVPCWLERRNENRVSPEVLDKDSVGWFGKIESRIWIDYKKMKPEEYGKTWRCWLTRPTNEELNAAAWEE